MEHEKLDFSFLEFQIPQFSSLKIGDVSLRAAY